MSLVKSKSIPVISLPSGTIYACRTEAGGLFYWDDTIDGTGCYLVDMTLANPSHLRIVLEMHDCIDRNFHKMLRKYEREDDTGESTSQSGIQSQDDTIPEA